MAVDIAYERHEDGKALIRGEQQHTTWKKKKKGRKKRETMLKRSRRRKKREPNAKLRRSLPFRASLLVYYKP